MSFEPCDLEKAKKLGVSRILELALKIPLKYEDTRVDGELIDGMECAVEGEVLSKHKTSKTLFFEIKLLSHNGKVIRAIFFSPKAYHDSIFHIGERVYLYGKISLFPIPSIIHPKKISNVGEIRKIYQKGPQNKIAQMMVKKYITIDNLISQGLDESSAKALYTLHFPNSLSEIFDGRKLKKDFIYALKLTEIYDYIRELRGKKTVFMAKPIMPKKLDDFLSRLPFTLTDDQKKAIDECREDIKKGIAAKRVIIGDVGCGKTMVILAIAHMSDKNKTILLAPTAILANQIYDEAKKYLSLKSVLVTKSSKTEDEQIESADFIIGTHALLYRQLPECGVVIVDEQHRFGSAQRQQIAKLVSKGDTRPHYFQFSATPIPRTQALISSALVDVTLIKQTPIQKKITTKIISKNEFRELFSHLKEQINAGYQAAIIYPLVEKSDTASYMSLEEAEAFWRSHFKKVFVTHGQDSAKEDVFEEFRDGGELILSTTVMEVGISLPKLSTIVVVGAEKLGLATLHQLRGRVARNTPHGWCYLFTKNPDNKRLLEFAKTTSGFDIANLDLKYRSCGDILGGKEQSGKQFEYFDAATDSDIAQKAKELLDYNTPKNPNTTSPRVIY